MESTKISIPQSKHFCEYACSQSSNGYVAKLLNLEPSRVSEIKRGVRRLKVEEADILRNNFGIPSSTPGHFYHGIVVNDVDYYRIYRPGSQESHMMHLLRFVSESANINELLSGFQLGTDVFAKSKDQYAAKLSQVNKLLSSDGFNSWVSTMRNKLGSFFTRPSSLERDVIYKNNEIEYEVENFNFSQSSESLAVYAKREFNIIFVNSIMEYTANRLLLIGCLKQTLEQAVYPEITAFNECFELGKVECGKIPEDIVINGRTVWESRNDLIPRQANEAIAFDWVSNNKYEYDSVDYGEWHLPVTSEAKSIFQKKYSSAQISLIWSESYNYFIKIGLNEVVPDIADDNITPYYCSMPYDYIIVKVSKVDQVFSELMGVIKSLGINEIEVADIKRVVALNGGFIPNAKYIS